MKNSKAKILMLVEGSKTDKRLMEHLFEIYGIDTSYEIVSYDTNIYVLYQAMFDGVEPDDMDLLQVLKEREKDPDKAKIFEQRYTDILLIFDLDPQDALFEEHKVISMLVYFNESTENGKLYLNYPMVEAFYHMKSIPDPDFDEYTATMSELRSGEYKKRVQAENRNGDYRKYAQSREECNAIIWQNMDKAGLITENPVKECVGSEVAKDIFSVQADMLRNKGLVYVLCTCVFFIAEYNWDLIE